MLAYRRHPDRPLEKAGIVAYCISVVAIILALHATCPWWAIVLEMPLVIIAGVGCIGIVAVPFLLPFYLCKWVMERVIGARKRKSLSQAELVAELERDGLLISATFRATRAFQVSEFEDEGPHYFLELDNGNIYYQNGHYLYSSEAEADADLEADGTAATDGNDDGYRVEFPCTQFEVRRHRDKKYIVDVLCQGELLDEETAGRGMDEVQYFLQTHSSLQDGDIISDISYDELRALFSERGL